MAAQGDALAALLQNFGGITLDAEAQDTVMVALEACAARHRPVADATGEAAADAAEDDPAAAFVSVPPGGNEYRGPLLPPGHAEAEFEPFDPDEPHWSEHGADVPAWVTPLQDAQAPSRAIIDVPSHPAPYAAGDPAPGVAAVKRPKRRRGPG